MVDYRLPDVVRGHAKQRGDAPALTLGERTVTYAQLDARSNRVAQALQAAGIGEGDRVALWDLNGLEFFELLFGVAKIGAVLAPVNFRLAPPEVQQILDDSTATVLVVSGDFVEQLGELSLPDAVEHLIVIGDADGVDGATTYEDWLDDADEIDPGFVGDVETVVIQLYTSGTTGVPKGVLLGNRNFGTVAEPYASEWDVDADTNSLVAMPLFHIGGTGWALVPLYTGGHSVVIREIEPEPLLDTMESERITNAFLVPAVLRMLADVPGSGDRDWSALRSIAYGASPITSSVLKKVLSTFGCPMFQVYGMTETTGAVVQLDADDHDPDGPREYLLASAGKPYDFNELRIVAPDGTTEQNAGETGEIMMRSPANLLGYWKRPEETAEKLTDDGWLRTGDAGHVDDDGYLFITDRIKDMIVSGGENIYPIEVEQALSDHDAVADVAVIGVPHDKWGETVKAVVVADGDVSEDELIAFATERIARYKRPTSVDFVDELPRSATGKLLKKDLRAPYWEGQEREIG